ncbi:MAG: UbiA family prenyltransferase, partial [Thermoplasmata archaeon]|nr:UbiA family prenyltransferase [Thermoplasmata archaeon]
MLVAAVTGALATIAGAEAPVVAQLGIAMLGIQFGIGTVNDVADASHDAVVKPEKAIPAGLVSPVAARLVAGVALGGGLLLAAPGGPLTLAVAALGAGSGLAYDLRLKGTVLSWAPFVVAVPLVPAFAWLGVTGALPGPILVAALLAAPAGGALALANALPDIEL